MFKLKTSLNISSPLIANIFESGPQLNKNTYYCGEHNLTLIFLQLKLLCKSQIEEKEHHKSQTRITFHISRFLWKCAICALIVTQYNWDSRATPPRLDAINIFNNWCIFKFVSTKWLKNVIFARELYILLVFLLLPFHVKQNTKRMIDIA